MIKREEIRNHRGICQKQKVLSQHRSEINNIVFKADVIIEIHEVTMPTRWMFFHVEVLKLGRKVSFDV